MAALLRTLSAPACGLTPAQTNTCMSDALATLCNVTLDFAPMKRLLVDTGGVALLLRLADSHAPLLAHVLWLLKNTAMHADPHVRTQLMAATTYPRLVG